MHNVFKNSYQRTTNMVLALEFHVKIYIHAITEYRIHIKAIKYSVKVTIVVICSFLLLLLSEGLYVDIEQ